MKRVAIAGIALFAVLVALGVHGYSLPIWHEIIDGSEPEGVLLGELRPLRTDDWLVGIPLALAQAHHDPAFPRVNREIGQGQDLILTDIPILHWSAVFRPFSWGYFLGDDAGIAWMWWSQLFGFVAVAFALLRAIAPGHNALAAGGALLLTASPFLQFWALLPARFVVYAGLGILGALGVLRARTPRVASGYTLLLAWGLGCLGLALYPPYQLPLAQLATLIVLALAWERRAALRANPGPPLIGLAVGAAATLAIGVGFALDAGDTLQRMLTTAYPGERVSLGSDLPLWRIFAHDLLIGRVVNDWSPVLNIAEGASFWLFFPVTGAIALTRAVRGRADPLSLALFGYALLLTVYASVGLPSFVAKLTGLSWAQPSRTLIALGVADVLLLVRVLTQRGDETDFSHTQVGGIVVAWAAFLAWIGSHVAATFSSVDGFWIAFACLINGAVVFAILRGWRPEALVGLCGSVMLATTFFYNPLVRGGSEFLRTNALSQQIVALDDEAGGESVWISYGPPFPANLFRVLGVRAITGAQPVPQLELWRSLDPGGEAERIYNRYAHVTARSAGTPGVRFRLASPDSFELLVEPGAPELLAIGVTHALIYAPAPPQLAGVEHVGSHGRNHLYRVTAQNDEAPR